MLQWSWNGQLSRERIDAVLDQCVEQGMGGFFTHIRPGLTTPYIGEEWFEFWDYAARRCAELGLEWHIYDEYTAGGGAGGGHTVARFPQAVQRELAVVPVVSADQAVDARGWFRLDEHSGAATELTRVEAMSAVAGGQPVVAAVVQIGPGGARRNALGPVDLYHPDTAREFIATTHEKYAEKSGDLFGTTVKFCFNDEPHTNQSKTAYPWSPVIVREFHRDHGYAIEEKLKSLLFAQADSLKVRYDFYRTLDRLYNLGFVKPLHDWCAENRLEFTGHFMEHEWPRPTSQPNSMAALRWMQAPGNDYLGFQYSEESIEANAIYFLNLKELASVANQFARKHVMVESSGAGGWHRSFDLFKPCEDILLAFGVSVMDPHLSHYSIAGARKYDFAQSLSDHSHWWQHYRPHADHIGRVIAAQREAREVNRVLVLHPTTTGWMYHQPRGWPWAGSENDQRLTAMRESHTAFVLALYRRFVDFDLGDEVLMEETGSVDGGKLRVGEGSYELVVIPPDLETLSKANLTLLESWLESGGCVLQSGDALRRVDARESSRPAQLRERFDDQWERFDATGELIDRVCQRVPPRIGVERADGTDEGAALVWRRSALPDGDVLVFLTNPWREVLEATVVLEAGTVFDLETASGALLPVVSGDKPGAGVEVSLPPRGHRFLLVGKGGVDYPVTQPAEIRETGTAPVTFEGAQVDGENLLPIGYCDFEANGRVLTDVPTPLADRMNWEWQGFPCSPWLMTGGSKPFAGDIDRTTIPADSTMRTTYRFTVAEGLDAAVRSGIALGVERPWLYEITVNGTPLPTDEGQPWLDPDARRFAVGDLLQPGENSVALAASPFQLLCEVAPVTLIGGFSVIPARRGFRITNPVELALGDWTGQGAPFYDATATYRFGVACEPGAARLRLRMPDWKGSVATVRWNGSDAGRIYHPPYELDLAIGGAGGKHTLEITIYGITQNKMGPWFTDGSVHVVSAWLRGPESMPPGSEYRFLPSGLMQVPELRKML